VLVFDHRFLGDSPGEPRQRFRWGAQREDWRAAVAFARQTEGIDPERIVLWGFSFGGGLAIETAAADARVAATIALCPLVDGLARVLSTPPRQTAAPRKPSSEMARSAMRDRRTRVKSVGILGRRSELPGL
jgi:acetyl esterase/lipase